MKFLSEIGCLCPTINKNKYVESLSEKGSLLPSEFRCEI